MEVVEASADRLVLAEQSWAFRLFGLLMVAAALFFLLRTDCGGRIACTRGADPTDASGGSCIITHQRVFTSDEVRFDLVAVREMRIRERQTDSGPRCKLDLVAERQATPLIDMWSECSDERRAIAARVNAFLKDPGSPMLSADDAIGGMVPFLVIFAVFGLALFFLCGARHTATFDRASDSIVLEVARPYRKSRTMARLAASDVSHAEVMTDTNDGDTHGVVLILNDGSRYPLLSYTSNDRDPKVRSAAAINKFLRAA